jgi:hypothetical protein
VTTDPTQIKRSAAAFRNALERSDLGFLPTLADFPNGSCGDAALLLGRFLRDSGFGDFDYVCGEAIDAGRTQTHAWLQRDGLIIDITADQFDGVDASVLVTHNHEWHDRFRSEVKHIADWTIYDDNTRSSLARAYKTVLSTLGDIEQIVGRERRERVSHHNWSGDA